MLTDQNDAYIVLAQALRKYPDMEGFSRGSQFSVEKLFQIFDLPTPDRFQRKGEFCKRSVQVTLAPVLRKPDSFLQLAAQAHHSPQLLIIGRPKRVDLGQKRRDWPPGVRRYPSMSSESSQTTSAAAASNMDSCACAVSPATPNIWPRRPRAFSCKRRGFCRGRRAPVAARNDFGFEFIRKQSTIWCQLRGAAMARVLNCIRM